VNWTSPQDIPYRGLLKVRILPPRDLLIPVIPIRCDQRMLFCLCFRCAITFKKKNTKIDHICPHNDEERAFTSTITSIELSEALKQKYVVTQFYRAWEYTQFSDNIFKDYVRYVKQ
jgi:5-methylcytosine-specific restriction endonuclease McrA